MKFVTKMIFLTFCVMMLNAKKLMLKLEYDNTCPIKKQVQKTPTHNGCGPEGNSFFSNALNSILITIAGKEKNKCCDTHDICYGTCRGNITQEQKRKDCDTAMYNCFKNLGSTVRAEVFYQAIDKGGKQPFLIAQRDFCPCKK